MRDKKMNEPRIETYSSIRTFQTCPQMYKYKYVDLIKRRQISHTLFFGKAFHAAIEAWYMGKPDIDLSDVLDSIERLKLKALIEGYKIRYQDDNRIGLLCEVTVSLRLKKPMDHVEIRGKTDRLRYGQTRTITPYETKTSSEDIAPGSQYWVKLQQDLQVNLYHLMLTSAEYNVPMFVYDVVAKPKQRLRKGETEDEFYERLIEDIGINPDKYYQRGNVYLSKRDQMNAELDIGDTCMMISSEIYPRHTGNCFKFNRACDFWPVCNGESSILNEDLYEIKTSKHEELEV
jgi:hypothetical protein